MPRAANKSGDRLTRDGRQLSELAIFLQALFVGKAGVPKPQCTELRRMFHWRRAGCHRQRVRRPRRWNGDLVAYRVQRTIVPLDRIRTDTVFRHNRYPEAGPMRSANLSRARVEAAPEPIRTDLLPKP